MHMFDTYKNTDEFKEACGYTIDDAWYPRVTKIVSIKAKPALYGFYAQNGLARGKAITEKSAEEGTLIHETVEALMLGQEPEIPASIAPAVKAFQEFEEKLNIRVQPENVERRIMSKDHRYAGTIDALATIDGKFGVLDIKTSQAIYRDYNLQTSAYMDALKNRHEDLETRWILRIDQVQRCYNCAAIKRTKGGKEKVRTHGFGCDDHAWGPMEGVIELKEFPFWQEDFSAFLGAKRLWEWENEYWLKRIGYLN